jgi:hypothetical protein
MAAFLLAPERAYAEDARATIYSLNPSNIAPTVATEPYAGVTVAGKPRMAVGHPNTIWDTEDIARFRALLKTNAEFQAVFERLKEQMDERIRGPIDVPPPQKGADGAWLYPGDYFPDFPGGVHSPVQKFTLRFGEDSLAVYSLGLVYALTGDERYAEYAKALLVAYSNMPRYGPSEATDYRYERGLTHQILEDAVDLISLARGYDLIHNSPSLSPEDRARIHDELLKPLASVMLYPTTFERDASATFARMANNRGAIGATAVLLAGYATDDEELVDAALYGTRATIRRASEAKYRQFPPAKDWVAATADSPTNGLLAVAFGRETIAGGMWVEGSPGYSFYALSAMINAAEACWRHGVDLYSRDGFRLKQLFDFPLLVGYPDATMPAENDSGRFSLAADDHATLYEYAYRRYRDPRYLAIIDAPRRSPRDLIYPPIPASPPSILYDLDPREAAPRISLPDVNYPTVGYGVLRAPARDGDGVQSLTLSYGPAAAHGHPDKLHIDLWALGGVLMPSPGVIFPYDNPLDVKWHWTTLAHNTLTVDEQSQLYRDYDHRLPSDNVRADQIVYGPGDTVGLQRAWSDTAYPGVTIDRAVFLTGRYLADLFAAVSATPHTYDLAWHVRGAPVSDLPFAVTAFSKPVPNGYNAFTSVQEAPATADAWSIAFERKGRIARLLAAGGRETRPILGDGGRFIQAGSLNSDDGPDGKSVAPTLIERRANVYSTIFGNVLDLTGGADGYIKAVSQAGGEESGYALLRIETRDGVDVCFASYRPGAHATDDLATDARQAMVQRNGASPRMLYLAGGTLLTVGDASIRRSEEGLAYVEATPGGGYILGNPSPAGATLTVKLEALAGLEAFEIDGDGKPIRRAETNIEADGEISVRLRGASRVRFAVPNRVR